jgi:transposase InsO family protein
MNRSVMACGEKLAYGYRRVAWWLQRKKGLPVNRKRVLRVMRERGLLVRSRRLRARRRKEWGRVEASAPNQIWQSDMTKIWAGQVPLVVGQIERRSIKRSGISRQVRTGRRRMLRFVLQLRSLERICREARGPARMGQPNVDGSVFERQHEERFLEWIVRSVGNCRSVG